MGAALAQTSGLLEVSKVRLGMSLAILIDLKGNPRQKQTLSKTSYELAWSDGTAATIEKDTNAVTEVTGKELFVSGTRFAKPKMKSNALLVKAEALKWPKPTVITPENHAFLQKPLSQEGYCTLHFRFAKERVTFNFQKDSLESVTISVKQF
jgi:hypothetical protein